MRNGEVFIEEFAMRIPVLSAMLLIAMMGSAMAIAADQLLAKYFVIQKSLASDSMNGVTAAAAEIEKLSRQAAATNPKSRTQLLALSKAAARFSAADLKSARDAFGELSEAMIAYLKASRAKTNPPYQFYCSMVKKNWLQPDKTVRNPYYGSAMPKCGELVQTQKSETQSMGRHH